MLYKINKVRTFREGKYSGLFRHLFFICLAIVLLYFLNDLYGNKFFTDLSGTKITDKVTSLFNKQPEDEVYKVSFSYTVKTINPSKIVLNGEKGDFVLENDPQSVKLYQGSSIKSKKLPLDALKEGERVNMEFVPGKTANLFLMEEDEF